MKFEGEEGEASLNAKDALLLWCKNKCQGYSNVAPLENLTTSFHDGIALCAIIHKHRPALIPNIATLNKENKKENILLAQDAAFKYFGLEKYITPDELFKLDENSMTVYISEFYYGIAEQRKVDLAARRLTKLIAFTIQNDNTKKQYNEEVLKLVAHMKEVGKLLGNRQIDNTMAGAKKRIEEFYQYKSKDKNEILQSQLTLEALYNNLSMILAQHKRPDYVPPAGCSLKDIEATVAELEVCEQERKIALHAELNRQIKLVRDDETHLEQFEKLSAWGKEKRAYCETKEDVNSVGIAIYQIATLDAFDVENKGVQETIGADLSAKSDEMAGEKYENIARVAERVQASKELFALLNKLSAAKKLVLEDDLAREEFREKVRLMNENHVNIHKRIMNWVAVKENYLNVKEQIDSVVLAQEHIAIIEGYDAEKKSMEEAFVKMLRETGKKIKASVYQTTYSSYQFENPEILDSREGEVDAAWEKLTQMSTHKHAVLADDLAREQFKDKLRLKNQQHAEAHEQILKWIKTKEDYLNVKEQVDSVALANVYFFFHTSFSFLLSFKFNLDFSHIFKKNKNLYISFGCI